MAAKCAFATFTPSTIPYIGKAVLEGQGLKPIIFGQSKKPPFRIERRLFVNINPGTELFSQAATHQVSSPLQRFTSEFGMESVWCHWAIRTRKTVGFVTHKTLETA